MTESFSMGLEQARAYEERFVPALFAQWAPVLLARAGVVEGQQVLDVACGTGVVARAARELVGPSGEVSGVDLNPAMVAVARERAPEIDWRVGDATSLPFDDESFDVAVCQSALFFFPDRAGACREMARVVRPGGKVALQTYAALDEQPGYGPFVDVVVRHAGAQARDLLGTYWSAGDPAELGSLLTGAGLQPSPAETVVGQVRFPSVDALVDTEVRATPLVDRIEPGSLAAMIDDARAALAEHVDEQGGLVMPLVARFIAAGKARR